MLTVTPYEVKTHYEMVLYRILKRKKSYDISVFTIYLCFMLRISTLRKPPADNYRVLLTSPEKIEIWHCEKCLQNDRKVMEIKVWHKI